MLDTPPPMRPIRLRANPSQSDLEAAYAQGVLRKESLQQGKYYQGWCRNAKVAMWDATLQKFFYVRTKFAHKFIEVICHPADEPYYDVFLPLGLCEPSADETVANFRQIKFKP